jgi:hypothetical protein
VPPGRTYRIAWTRFFGQGVVVYLGVVWLKESDEVLPRLLDPVTPTSATFAPFDCRSADAKVAKVTPSGIVNVEFQALISEFHADREVLDADPHPVLLSM